MDLIDHFSKWLGQYYLLKNKEAELILAKIKFYIGSNGVCKIFQSDNGKEFNNNMIKIYLENNNIIYICSAPYHPESKGCYEAVHKEIKTFLLDELEKKDNFDIDISIGNAIECHSNRKLNSIVYEPVILRNATNKNVIEPVINLFEPVAIAATLTFSSFYFGQNAEKLASEN